MINKCVRCGETFAMNCMLPLAEITETGKVIFPNETKEQSVQVPVMLCLKCMAFVKEGWINVYKIPNQDKLQLVEICDKKDSPFGLKFFEERYKIGELTKDIEESLKKEEKTRKEVKKQKLKNSPLRIAIIVEEQMKAFDKSKKELKEKPSQKSTKTKEKKNE